MADRVVLAFGGSVELDRLVDDDLQAIEHLLLGRDVRFTVEATVAGKGFSHAQKHERGGAGGLHGGAAGALGERDGRVTAQLEPRLVAMLVHTAAGTSSRCGGTGSPEKLMRLAEQVAFAGCAGGARCSVIAPSSSAGSDDGRAQRGAHVPTRSTCAFATGGMVAPRSSSGSAVTWTAASGRLPLTGRGLQRPPLQELRRGDTERGRACEAEHQHAVEDAIERLDSMDSLQWYEHAAAVEGIALHDWVVRALNERAGRHVPRPSSTCSIYRQEPGPDHWPGQKMEVA